MWICSDEDRFCLSHVNLFCLDLYMGFIGLLSTLLMWNSDTRHLHRNSKYELSCVQYDRDTDTSLLLIGIFLRDVNVSCKMHIHMTCHSQLPVTVSLCCTTIPPFFFRKLLFLLVCVVWIEWLMWANLNGTPVLVGLRRFRTGRYRVCGDFDPFCYYLDRNFLTRTGFISLLELLLGNELCNLTVTLVANSEYLTI